jgi:hypothetical protein
MGRPWAAFIALNPPLALLTFETLTVMAAANIVRDFHFPSSFAAHCSAFILSAPTDVAVREHNRTHQFIQATLKIAVFRHQVLEVVIIHWAAL